MSKPMFSIFESEYATMNRTTDAFKKAFEVLVEELEKGPGCSDSDLDETAAYASLIKALARLVTQDDATWESDRAWTQEDVVDIVEDLETIGLDSPYAVRAAMLMGGAVEKKWALR